MTVTRVLTGITTSGIPHLGNYVGAIRPTVAASRMPGTRNFYFLADMHALIKVQDPAKVQRSTLEIAASWLACGLEPDNDRVWFYRQSDVPEIAELTWLLTCVAGKGILNRAHAYKAAVDKNRAEGEDDDFGITAGLFMYPVLMAADILIFNAHKVPVGRDQIQHIEMARDFAQRFNHLYGDHLVLPEAAVEEHVATLPGLDGRKMSKSYDNTIPLFCSREQLKKLIFSIVTDSRAPGEAKDTEGSALFQLYQAFASAEETAAMRAAFADGIGWGDAKQMLFERIDSELSPMRERYNALMAQPEKIEAMLREGAAAARERHGLPLMRRLREAVGFRDLSKMPRILEVKASLLAGRAFVTEDGVPPKQPSIKQYRDSDGRFYFKLVDGSDRILLQSLSFENPKEAGNWVSKMKNDGHSSLALINNLIEPIDQTLENQIFVALDEIREIEIRRIEKKNS
ncbi:MAG: tryptophan--tRNA ligase [Xanthomonadales bacterium]|nr:tryptophan--tRNA ligase [Xanthomonadales bacterium]